MIMCDFSHPSPVIYLYLEVLFNKYMEKSLNIDEFRIKSDSYFNGNPKRDNHGPFIRGPLYQSWFKRAIAAGSPAVLVGLVLWYRKGIEKSNIVRLTNVELKKWGITRYTKYRGLHQLESAGLIEIKRKYKRNPMVQILLED